MILKTNLSTSSGMKLSGLAVSLSTQEATPWQLFIALREMMSSTLTPRAENTGRDQVKIIQQCCGRNTP